ncbi:MAG: hypothetical protein ACTHLY_21805 [Pseudolabrys sp.]
MADAAHRTTNKAVMRRVLFLRVTLTVIGGYIATSAVVYGLAILLPFAGMARSEAVVTASMLGFIIYLCALLWGAAERRLLRLGLGYAALTAAGIAPWALSRIGG